MSLLVFIYWIVYLKYVIDKKMERHIGFGGGERIRTSEAHHLPHFKCGTINRSATPPFLD